MSLPGVNAHLFGRTLSALSLGAPYEAVNRSLQAYAVFVDTLERWTKEESLISQLSPEDLAWAQHTIGKPEEITYRALVC